MYYIRSENSFDSAHFLKGYEGKCSNIHGHRWRVVAELFDEKLKEDGQTRGMVIDFSDIKEALKGMCDELDHCLIYEKASLKPKTIEALNEENFRLFELPFRPTAENFAAYFFRELKAKGFNMHRVEVYETPGNVAVYEE
ncbi:MAG: 6-carboxytetrahydropterin synthase [Lachnospiraceae bacterium]|nr:6-carboxytetrahydropterin synthase [Lachnospiraceae bacterium]